MLAVFVYVISGQQGELAQPGDRRDSPADRRRAAQAVTLQGFGDFAGIKEARLSAVKSLATAPLRLGAPLPRARPRAAAARLADRASTPQARREADGGGELGPTHHAEGLRRQPRADRRRDGPPARAARGRGRRAHADDRPARTRRSSRPASARRLPRSSPTTAAAAASTRSRCRSRCRRRARAGPSRRARPGAARRWRMTLTDRDRKIVMIIVPLVVVLAYWFLLLTPKREAASRGRRHARDRAGRACGRPDARQHGSRGQGQLRARLRSRRGARQGDPDVRGHAEPARPARAGRARHRHRARRHHDGRARPPPPSRRGRDRRSPRRPARRRSGEPPQSAPGQAAADAQAAADTASTPPPTADGTATAPTAPAAAGAAGSAPPAGGLESVSMEFKFKGDFFELADFFHRLKRFVYVDGRQGARARPPDDDRRRRVHRRGRDLPGPHGDGQGDRVPDAEDGGRHRRRDAGRPGAARRGRRRRRPPAPDSATPTPTATATP